MWLGSCSKMSSQSLDKLVETGFFVLGSLRALYSAKVHLKYIF